MKTVGLIGGMSWESTIPYYTIINEYVKEHLGNLHSAKLVLYSVDFDVIEKAQRSGEWEKVGQIVSDAAQKLEAAGVDYILICTNTVHKVFDLIQKSVSVPIVHIAQAVSDVLREKDIVKVGLLGTKYTVLEEFYKEVLIQNGLEVYISDLKDIEILNSIIFDELCIGQCKKDSQKKLIQMIEKLKEKGVQGIVLGCTELGLLIQEKEVCIPLFDSTKIHAQKGAELLFIE